MPNLIRPANGDNASHNVDVGSSGGGLYSGTEAGKVDDDTVEESRLPSRVVRPIAPTKAELSEHEPLHLNYRSWCPDCVWGKGHSKHHRASKDEPIDEVTWHMDYCFFNRTNMEEYDIEKEGSMPVLVAYDELKEAMWALQVDKKGAESEVVKWCCDTLEDSGDAGSSVSIKTDQEPAIVNLRRAIAANRVGDTVPLNSPVRSSKSNGRVENAVKRFQGHLRVLKHSFEGKIKRHLPADSALLSWLIVWTAESLNNF